MAGPPLAKSLNQIHQAKLGDAIIVCGVEFVLTAVHLQLDKPPALTTKTPEELRTIDPLQEL